jgi:hypothetical protein
MTFLEFVIEKYIGPPARRSGNGVSYWHCPFHSPDNRPSFHTLPVDARFKHRCLCHACCEDPTKPWDAFDFLMFLYPEQRYPQRLLHLERLHDEYTALCANGNGNGNGSQESCLPAAVTVPDPSANGAGYSFPRRRRGDQAKTDPHMIEAAAEAFADDMNGELLNTPRWREERPPISRETAIEVLQSAERVMRQYGCNLSDLIASMPVQRSSFASDEDGDGDGDDVIYPPGLPHPLTQEWEPLPSRHWRPFPMRPYRYDLATTYDGLGKRDRKALARLLRYVQSAGLSLDDLAKAGADCCSELLVHRSELRVEQELEIESTNREEPTWPRNGSRPPSRLNLSPPTNRGRSPRRAT